MPDNSLPPMTPDSQTPALSPEEWKQGGFDVYPGGECFAFADKANSLRITIGEEQVQAPPDRRYALAALCLFGQPFGFDQADVDLLTIEANQIEQGAKWCPEGWSVDNSIDQAFIAAQNERAQQFRSLATRISHLIPPREDVTSSPP